MDFDVEESTVLPHPHVRRARHGRKEFALVEDAKPAWPLRDEQTSIGQERQSPWRLEILGNDLERDGLLLRFDDGALRVDLRLGLSLLQSGLSADVEHQLTDLLVVDEILERDHCRRRTAVADARRDTRVVAAELPDVVDEAACGAALKRGTVTRGAELRVDCRARHLAAPAAAWSLSLCRSAGRSRRRRGGRRLRRILRWRSL